MPILILLKYVFKCAINLLNGNSPILSRYEVHLYLIEIWQPQEKIYIININIALKQASYENLRVYEININRDITFILSKFSWQPYSFCLVCGLGHIKCQLQNLLLVTKIKCAT